MSGELLYSRSETFIAVVLFALLLLSAEVGYRVGGRKRTRFDEATKSQVGTIQGAILGLLGLLLGFSFAMAVSRFEDRKQMVIQEANAIGTAFLRAQLISSPQREDAAALFRSYVDARVRSSHSRQSRGQPAGSDEEVERLQGRLWALAVSVALQDTRSVPTGLFVQSLNEVLDSTARHDAALKNHVPESVLFLLFLVSVTAVGVMGYGVGLAGNRAAGALASLSLLVALVVLVVVDLDRPYRGLLKVSEQNMLELREGMARASREPSGAGGESSADNRLR